LRGIFIGLAILIFITGLLFSFLGAYDTVTFNANKKQVYTTTGTELASRLQITKITDFGDYDGVVGLQVLINDNPILPQLFTNDDDNVTFKEEDVNGKNRWGTIKIPKDKTLKVKILIPQDGGIQVTYAITIFKTSKGVKAIPRTIGTLVFVIFVGVLIGYEVAIWRDKKKYGNAEDSGSKRFEAQFEMSKK